jgi:hypothetical protein
LTEVNNNTYFLPNHIATRIIGIGGGGEPVEMMINGIRTWSEDVVVGYISYPQKYHTNLSIAQKMINSFQLINAR